MLEPDKFLVWSPGQVIVSVALSCPLACPFCYVDSIIPALKAPQVAGLGIRLAEEVLADRRFRHGAAGTAVFVGGFTEPLLAGNQAATIGFLNTLGERAENPVHLATRLPVRRRFLRSIRYPRRLVIGYSASDAGSWASSRDQIGARLRRAGEVREVGIKQSLYVRPVIPGRTLQALAELIPSSLAAGITVAAVGGLFVDDAISRRLSATDTVPVPTIDTGARHVLDFDECLREVPSEEVDAVKEALRRAGFLVFDSTRALLSCFAAL